MQENAYLILFFALLVGGETVLVPAVCLALVGKLQVLPLIGVASLATLISDSAWYLMGRLLPLEKISELPWLGRKWPQGVAYVSDLFKRHGLKAVFVSKFLYGTRIAAQMLAGVTRIPYMRYITVNIGSVLAWLGFILLLGFIVNKSADALNVRVHRVYFVLISFLTLIVAGRLAARHFAARMLAIPSGQPQPRPQRPSKVISAIVPAFNESETVADVVRALEEHASIDEVIVVDDGSTDATAERVRATSARLVSFPSNQGKAAAMAKGVELARNETIFFVDADLRGLTAEVIDSLINPVVSGEFDMFVAIRDRRQSLLNKIVYFSPILGGERVLKKSLWYQVPSWCVQSFQIEIALNYFSKRCGGKMGFELMPGLMHIKKEKKRGFLPGAAARVKMYAELVSIAFKLYVIHSAISIFSDRLGGRGLPVREPALPPS